MNWDRSKAGFTEAVPWSPGNIILSVRQSDRTGKWVWAATNKNNKVLVIKTNAETQSEAERAAETWYEETTGCCAVCEGFGTIPNMIMDKLCGACSGTGETGTDLV